MSFDARLVRDKNIKIVVMRRSEENNLARDEKINNPLFIRFSRANRSNRIIVYLVLRNLTRIIHQQHIAVRSRPSAARMGELSRRARKNFNDQ